MRKRPLMLIACVFLAGLVYQKYSWWSMMAILLLFLSREIWSGRKTGTFRKSAGRSMVLLSAFLLGVLHMQAETEFRDAYMSKLVDGSRITVWGELIKMEPTEYGNRGTLSDCYINFGEGVIPCNDIMVYTSNDQYQIGQIHKIIGKVNMFSKARNEGNFDSYAYYQSLKIDFAIDEEESNLLQENGNPLRMALNSLRQGIGSVYNSCLKEKAAGFYRAMVLGDKAELDKALKDLFLIGGISHILAISGLHVSVLGRGVYRVFRNTGAGFAFAGVSGGVLLILYCIMVGGSTSTVRAVGMLLLFFLSQSLGRSYDMLNALGGMGLFLLWENPFLIENSGFWFSITALVGVGVVGDEMSQWSTGKKEGKKRHIFAGSGLWMSLGITLSTLPVTALSYYEVSVYSALVNFVILPLLTPVFCLAVVCGGLGVLGMSYDVLAYLLLPCQWLLTFYEWVCELVSKFPYATVTCGKPKLWQVVVYYLVLLSGIYLMRLFRKNKEFMKRKIVFASIMVSCMLCIFFPKAKPFEISFLDVGQGDGIYISAGDGTTYFIDGGSSSVDGVGEYRILPFLKAKGVSKIDYWFVSHCDLDHVSGLYEMIENGYKIEHIVLHELCSIDKNQEELICLASNAGIKVIHMEVGHRICSSDMEITCIGPTGEMIQTDEVDRNENSLVLQVEWRPKILDKKFTALFAGDISVDVENELCKSSVLERVDLLKANHHGSNYSNGENWLATTCPRFIVISCSENNRYGHPGPKAIERMEAIGAEIFCTMENGQITFPLIQ